MPRLSKDNVASHPLRPHLGIGRLAPEYPVMRMISIVLSAAAALGLATTTIAAPAKPMKGAELASSATVTLAMARATALKARPGTITDQELEKEAGGSGLRYSFDITSNHRPFEVGIDARTGAILENKAEGKNPD